MSNNEKVAHRWAQDDPTLRVIRSEHMFYNQIEVPGDAKPESVIFSYGRHFPIAAFVNGVGGQRVCLITSQDSSPTTNRHKGVVRGALGPRANPLTVPYVSVGALIEGGGNWHEKNQQHFLELAAHFYKKAARARKWAESYRQDAEDVLSNAERYAAAFGLPFVRPPIDDVVRVVEERAAAQKEEAAKRQAEAHARVLERERERRELDAAEFESWRRGESDNHCPFSYTKDENGSAYLRRRTTEDYDEVQTSQGASVPWVAAVRLFRFAKLCRSRNEGWTAPPLVKPYVGDFRLDEVTAEGEARVNCHRISWQRMSELAVAQGVFEVEPGDELLTAARV